MNNNMQGSEKQISWATDILTQFDEFVESVKLAATTEVFADKSEQMIALIDHMANAVAPMRSDARTIIDKRDQLSYDFLSTAFRAGMRQLHNVDMTLGTMAMINAEANNLRKQRSNG
jgi:hypothetical protein